MNAALGFADYLNNAKRLGHVVVFPTGMGTELGNRTKLELPLWAVGPLQTAAGREHVRQVHLNSALIGHTNVITSATWMRRTAFQETAGAAWEAVSEEVFGQGVRVLLDAKAEIKKLTGRHVYAGVSFGPLSDSHKWTPDKQPSFKFLCDTHFRTAQILLDRRHGKPDFSIPETACNEWEARAMGIAASRAGINTNTPFIIGLTPGQDGNLRDGASLADTVARISDLNNFLAVAINCVPVAYINAALDRLSRNYDGPLIVYANGFGDPSEDNIGWKPHPSQEGDAYTDCAVDWLEEGVTGIGGCCGTESHSYGAHFGPALKAKRETRAFLRKCDAIALG